MLLLLLLKFFCWLFLVIGNVGDVCFGEECLIDFGMVCGVVYMKVWIGSVCWKEICIVSWFLGV